MESGKVNLTQKFKDSVFSNCYQMTQELFHRNRRQWNDVLNIIFLKLFDRGEYQKDLNRNVIFVFELN